MAITESKPSRRKVAWAAVVGVVSFASAVSGLYITWIKRIEDSKSKTDAVINERVTTNNALVAKMGSAYLLGSNIAAQFTFKNHKAGVNLDSTTLQNFDARFTSLGVTSDKVSTHFDKGVAMDGLGHDLGNAIAGDLKLTNENYLAIAAAFRAGFFAEEVALMAQDDMGFYSSSMNEHVKLVNDNISELNKGLETHSLERISRRDMPKSQKAAEIMASEIHTQLTDLMVRK